jgi:hypothetical protein
MPKLDWPTSSEGAARQDPPLSSTGGTTRYCIGNCDDGCPEWLRTYKIPAKAIVNDLLEAICRQKITLRPNEHYQTVSIGKQEFSRAVPNPSTTPRKRF